MPTSQEHAALIRSHYDALNRREIDKCLALATDDVKWMNIPFSTNFNGRDAYRQHLENWAQAMPDLKIEIVNVFAGDEWTAVEYVGRGTHTGPLTAFQGTLTPTQKKLDMKFCELVRVKDGKITEGHLYFDGAALMRQLGLMPQMTQTQTPPTQVQTPAPPVPASVN